MYTITNENDQAVPLALTDKVKDIGLWFDKKFRENRHEKSITPIHHIPTVSSHLDYYCPVWSPYREEDVEALEKVQKKAHKMIPKLKKLPYVDRKPWLSL